jgi:hypothetical protein
LFVHTAGSTLDSSRRQIRCVLMVDLLCSFGLLPIWLLLI